MADQVISRIKQPQYTEHRVRRGAGTLHVREYDGAGPAFVAMHGFPDNLHIFDDLVPILVANGRKVVTFDFLGFGESDKPDGQKYDFAQQLGDLAAVVDDLGLDRVVPVAHDAAGPTAINFALDHPHRVAGLVILNSVYSAFDDLDHPELIELFAIPQLRALTQAMLQKPELVGWVLNFQRDRFQETLDEEHQAYYRSFLGPVIDENFRRSPSSAPAFAQMVAGLLDEEKRNVSRISQLADLDIPVQLIWGDRDQYLRTSYAEYLQGKFRNAELHVLRAGHWPQLDEAPMVANIMLRPGEAHDAHTARHEDANPAV